jgi:hypothetical protein
MPNELQQRWDALGLLGTEIHSINTGGNREAMSKLRSLLSVAATDVTVPELTRKAASLLTQSIDHLQNATITVEQEFVDLIRALIAMFRWILGSDHDNDLSMFTSGLVDKITVYNDLYSNKINPTQTKPASPKVLGVYLLEFGFVTIDQIDTAVSEQKAGLFPGKRLGDILQAKGILTRAQLDQAIEAQMLDSMGG